jgi:hypothetical protein
VIVSAPPQSSDCEEELDPASLECKRDPLVNYVWLEGGLVEVILATPKLWIYHVMLVSAQITHH